MQRWNVHLVAVVLGVMVAAIGSVPLSAHAASQVPFKARLVAIDTLTPTGFNNVSTGYATHLGAFTMSGVGQTASLTYTSPTTAVTTSHETYVLVAANGDTVDLTNDATGYVTFTSPTTATIAVTGAWTITGGTGRFSGASGSGQTTATLYVNFASGLAQTTATFVGTISSPGSLR